MTARQHHFTPRYYLKGFADNPAKPKLRVFDRRLGKALPLTSIKNIGQERDFNRVDVPGLPVDDFESKMAQFDSDVSQALARTIAAKRFASEQDRILIANLVAVLAIRNPRWRDTKSDAMTHMARSMMDITLLTPERFEESLRQAEDAGAVPRPSGITYEDMKKFVDGGAFKVVTSNNFHVGTDLKTLMMLIPALVKRNWTVFRAPLSTGGFVTSDHPVCLTWTDQELLRGPYPPGFGCASTAVIVPLSRELAIQGTFEHAAPVVDATLNLVAGINGIVSWYANRQVYAADDKFVFLSCRDKALRCGRDLVRDWSNG